MCSICKKEMIQTELLNLKCGHPIHNSCFLVYINFESFIKDSKFIFCPVCKKYICTIEHPLQPLKNLPKDLLKDIEKFELYI